MFPTRSWYAFLLLKLEDPQGQLQMSLVFSSQVLSDSKACTSSSTAAYVERGNLKSLSKFRLMKKLMEYFALVVKEKS